jgi:phospholipid/cholesterol/gamma-HCH transport system permease protein
MAEETRRSLLDRALLEDFPGEVIITEGARTGLAWVGRQILRFFEDTGKVGILLMRGMGAFFSSGITYRGQILDQMSAIGVGSLPLVGIVALFTGAVAAVQAAYQLEGVVPLRYLGAVIERSVLIELGPVLTALVVGGRVGASIAAEIGTMRVTEQVDALEVLSVDPIKYLVMPRLVAALVMLPVIVVFANAIAIFGGFIVATFSFDQSPHIYSQALKQFFHFKDLTSGLCKSAFFGVLIALMGCHYGLASEGGAEGVGVATTRAVVASCVLVLVSDYVLANLLFRVTF